MVDASVARSAGRPAAAPKLLSGQCRAVLDAMDKTGHSVVLSEPILEEWKKHEGEFARGWRVRMYSRGRYEFVDDAPDKEFRVALSKASPSVSARRAMEKDAHLIEAASRTDRIVISLDDEARSLFRDACLQIDVLREILWANPKHTQEQVTRWLKDGAPPEGNEKRKLGSQ